MNPRLVLAAIAVSVAAAAAVAANPAASVSPISVQASVPDEAGRAVLQPFVSYSIEFAFFPDYAGNKSSPNRFSNQLLENLKEIQGVKPYIRVGGNTQDYYLYDANLKTATNGTVIPSRSKDYPYILFIGPSYFESYSTWPSTKFIHGFNLGKNGTVGMDSLLEVVPLACKALQDGRLAYWELGNEPDLYKTSSQGRVRPSWWNETDYVDEWLSKTRIIRSKMAETCPDLASDAKYKYMAPSFAGVTNSLNPVVTWRNGLDADHNIALNSEHNYIGGATQPGVTLQKTLMNHTNTVNSVAKHVNVSRILSSEGLTTGIPYILGETNSLYNEGAPGLSNAFGAALWGVDFNLYCASQSIRRTHMHQGTDYRYASWQPIQTDKTTIGTKPPYYGNVMVAEMLRGGDDVRVVSLPLAKDTEAAYAAYVRGELARVAIINMVEYNYTDGSSATVRPSATYSFQVPSRQTKTVSVQRLMANGSDSITGITWDGWSYNYELKQGAPVRLHNVTVGEEVALGRDGMVSIDVPYSSAAILNV